jgi:FHA domain
MKLKRCDRGHYYDAGLHSRCPSCGVSGLNLGITDQHAVTQDNDAPVNDLTPFPATQVRVAEPPFSPPQEIGTTVAIVHKAIGMDPVVGWLVCVSGPDKGRDFRIRSERNAVGRNPEMPISIRGDDSISRENHAFISYNPRKSSFRIAPGESRGLTYLNGEEVDTPLTLNAYDLIEIGQTQLLFIPLCGERFNWEQEGE